MSLIVVHGHHHIIKPAFPFGKQAIRRNGAFNQNPLALGRFEGWNPARLACLPASRPPALVHMPGRRQANQSVSDQPIADRLRGRELGIQGPRIPRPGPYRDFFPGSSAFTRQPLGRIQDGRRTRVHSIIPTSARSDLGRLHKAMRYPKGVSP